MKIITKLGASYIDHMSDDAPEVNSFSRGYYQSLGPRLAARGVSFTHTHTDQKT